MCRNKSVIPKNVHINNLVEQGKMEKAMSAARDMMNLGIEPNVITFTAYQRLVYGWKNAIGYACSKGDVEDEFVSE